jgi:hypothetical protein
MFRTISAAAVAVLLSSAAAFAQFRTVTVQNADGNPVPTTIQNTPTVNVTGSVGIAGTPAVSATVTNTPNVVVTNSPIVSVSNLPTGTAGPSNTTGLLTKALDNPALQPFQQVLACSTTAGVSITCSATFNVPAGKVLVIEYLHMHSFDSGGSIAAEYLLNCTAGGNAAIYQYGPETAITSTFHISEHQVRIYADPGSTVTFSGLESSITGSVTFAGTLSGHLVNVP